MVAGEELMQPGAVLQGVPASDVSRTIFAFLSNRLMEMGLNMSRKGGLNSEEHIAAFIQRWHVANLPPLKEPTG